MNNRIPRKNKLDLVPIMNLVTILIPVLLMALKSLEISVVNIDLPAIGPDDLTTKRLPLSLKVNIHEEGISITGAEQYIPENDQLIPCKNGHFCQQMDDYDWDKLRTILISIKKNAQHDRRDSDQVVLVMHNALRFGGLVKALDVTRDDPITGMKLFPKAVFASR
jgi:hypothetical protein